MIDVLVASAFDPELEGLEIPLGREVELGGGCILAQPVGVGPLAAVGLGDVRGVETRRGQRLLCLDRVPRLGVDLRRVRCDLPLGDLADRRPDRLVLLGQGVEPGVATHE